MSYVHISWLITFFSTTIDQELQMYIKNYIKTRAVIKYVHGSMKLKKRG